MKKAMAQVTGSARRNSFRNNQKKETTPSPEKQQPKNQSQMTADEAALTAKNYRLAKELSELRVRHREESKTVTKLTMENVRLLLLLFAWLI